MARSLVWLVIAWFGGSAAILGGLMTLGSLLLWLIPPNATKQSPTEPASVVLSTWRDRVRLLLFSLALALAGFSTLSLVPFSSY